MSVAFAMLCAPFSFSAHSGLKTRARVSPGVYVYYMSKREGYYGLSRGERNGTEELYTSRTILEKYRDKARCQVSYDVSPDGSWLAFSGLSEGGARHFRAGPAVEDREKHNRGREGGSRPLFSRDGLSIAYLTHKPGGRHYDNIAIAARDGSGKRLVTRDLFGVLSMEFLPGSGEMLFVKYIPFHSAVAKVDLEKGQLPLCNRRLRRWSDKPAPPLYLLADFFYGGLIPARDGDSIYFEGRCAGRRHHTPSAYLLDLHSDTVKRILGGPDTVTDLNIFLAKFN